MDSPTGGVQVVGADGKPILTTNAGEALVFQVDSKGTGLLILHGVGVPVGINPGPLNLRPVATAGDRSPAHLRFAGTRYRGEIAVLIPPGKGKLSVVNVVGVEDYLLGVVPKEVSPGWPPEAVKAQAVAARSYALAQRGAGKYAGLGFDLTDDTSSQVYGGIEAEHPLSTLAVQATRGQVVTYGGKLATTYFFSSSGGHTENNETIWSGGSPVPYLRGVPDPDVDSPYYRWEVSRTIPQLLADLGSSGRPASLGDVVAVRGEGRQGPSGRWSAWRVIGSLGETVVDAEATRWRFEVRSAPREFRVVKTQLGTPARTVQPDAPMTVLGAGGRTGTRSGNSLQMIGRAGAVPAVAARAVAAQGEIPAEYALVGGGWGHGIGMSQWGARSMAQQGKTYVEILRHYFQGTQVVAWAGK